MLRVGIGMLAVAAFVQASTLNTGQLFIDPDFSGGTGPNDQSANNNGPVSLTGSATGGANSSGSGSTFVNYGVIKLSGTFSSSGDTVARGIWRDDLTFNVAGQLAGTLADVTFSLLVGGGLSVTDIGQAGWQLQADLGDGAFDINAGGHTNPAQGGYTGDPFGVYSATVTVELGFVAPLDVEFTGSAQTLHSAQFLNGGTASFDLAHSLYWNGITGVSVGGVPVNSFSVTSGSGTPYEGSLAPAVPEPGTGLMMLGALGLVMFSARRLGRI